MISCPYKRPSERVRHAIDGYTHPTTARKLDALTVDLDGQNLGRTENTDHEKLVDGTRLELVTSALRTRRSPN